MTSIYRLSIKTHLRRWRPRWLLNVHPTVRLRRISAACLASGIFLASLSLHAFPDRERTSTTLTQPPLDLVSSQATSMVIDDDQFLYIGFGEEIDRVDLETWSLAADQVPALVDNSDESGGEDLRGTITGLALRGGFFYAVQADGDLLIIDLGQITENPDSVDLGNSSFGAMAADPETGTNDDQLYILDKTQNAVLVYDISEGEVTRTIPIKDSLGSAVTPVAILFADFPTVSSSAETDKIYVTSNSGLLFVIPEGSGAVSDIVTLASTNKEIPSLALTPDGNFLLLVNATDNTVHVVDTATDTEVDADSTASGTNPIALSPNSAPEGIAVLDVTDPEDTYAYVTGSGGVTVIDLNLGQAVFNGFSLIDFNDQGSDDDEDDPLDLASIPGPIIASSSGDARLYTSNADATLSIVSDNPFVTISGTSLGGESLGVGESFTVTFQSDEAGTGSAGGTYSVRVGGTLDQDGTEVTTGTVDTADTDVVTAAISYDATLFSEGANRVFVFVTDSEGGVGRDAVTITVDAPPTAVSITETGFGNGKVFLTFSRLTTADIDHYDIYVDDDDDGDGDCTDEAAEEAVATKVGATGTVSQSDSGETLTARISGLTNGQGYCLGVEAVDESGNVGPRATTLPDGSSATATPELTVGISRQVGESGCSLVPGRQRRRQSGAGVGGQGLAVPLALPVPPALPVVGWLAVVSLVVRRKRLTLLLVFTLHASLFPSSLFAKELSPQWWSLEFKGGVWKPRGAVVKDSFGFEPTGAAEFGFLWRSKLGIEVGAGVMDASSAAVGAGSGSTSEDRFNFLLVPVQNSVTFRADFKENQLLVPYLKGGTDYVFFRENVQGEVTRGIKYGLHGAAGLQILLEMLDELSSSLEGEMGVNDIYLTLEGRYAWVDNFGGAGLDLSNWMLAAGFLFEF